MKYIEELDTGTTFEKNSVIYLLTSDFKKDHKLAYSFKDGSCRWFKNDDIVDIALLYILDKDNNFVAIKETKKNAII